MTWRSNSTSTFKQQHAVSETGDWQLAALPQHPRFPGILSLLAFLLYLGTAWLVFEPRAVWSPDAGAKWMQLDSLRIESGRIAYDLRYPERWLDPELAFADINPSGIISPSNGLLQLRRLPLFPLLSLPFYRLFSFYGLYLLPALGGAAIVWLSQSLIEARQRRWTMAVLIALGSPVLVYASLFWEHTLATCLTLMAAWLALRSAPIQGAALPKGLLTWGGMGLLWALSAYLRLETSLFAAAFLAAAWLLLPERRWSLVWCGLILGGLMLGYSPLHSLLFGQSMPDNAAYLFYPAAYLKSTFSQPLVDLLIGPPVEEAIQSGWRGMLWAWLAAAAFFVSLVDGRYPVLRPLRWLLLAGTGLLAGSFLLTTQAYRSAHGLLFTTPWALLGLCRAGEVWQRGSPKMRVLVLTTLLGLTGYAIAILGFRASPPHGGLEWGARFALTFYPLLAILAGWDWGELRPLRAALPAAALLVFLGVGFQLRGVTVIRHEKAINHQLNQAILELPAKQVLSDLWWLRLNAAPILASREIYLADTPASQRRWLEMARQNGLSQFTLITMDRSLADRLASLSPEGALAPRMAGQYGVFYLYQVGLPP